MALSFSGSSQNLGVATPLATAVPLTFACWFKANSLSAIQALIWIGDAANNNEFALRIDTSGHVLALSKAANISSTGTTTTTCTTGTWYLAVAVFASVTSRTAYLNAAGAGNNATSSTVGGTLIKTAIAVEATSTLPFNGSIAYPTMWNLALSSTDITNLYNSGAGVNPRTIQSGNVISFTLLQGSAPFNDSITGNPWTVTGSPTVVADPFIVSNALSGTCTVLPAHTGLLKTSRRITGTCTVRTSNAGIIAGPNTQLLGTCTGRAVNTGDLFTTANRTFIGPCIVTISNTGTLKATKPQAGTCLVTFINSGLVAPPPRYDFVSVCTVSTNNTATLTVINVVARHISGAAIVNSLSFGQMSGPPRVVSDPPFPVMQWISIGLYPVVLFILQPNFATEIKVTLSIMDQVQSTQSNKGSRRAFTNTGRYTVEMECLCSNAQESTEVRLGLNRLKDDLVALPLWVDQVVLTTVTLAGSSVATYNGNFPPARYGAYWIFISTDLYLSEIIVFAAINSTTITFQNPVNFTWPAGSVLMPLIFGRFSTDNPPTLTKLTESINRCAFTFIENSPIGMDVNPLLGVLPVVQGNLGLSGPARLWDIHPTYSSSETDLTAVDIDYEQIGFARQDSRFVYPPAPRRITELSFELCNRATIAKIEQTFIDRRGRTVTLWVPTFRNDIDLITSLPTAGDARFIQVESTSRYLDTPFTTHPGYPFLCLNDNTSQPIFPFKIVQIAGDFLYTNVPITQSFSKSAKISALILSRFQEAQIQWTYRTDGYADTSIKFIEETEDYSAKPASVQEHIAQVYHFYNRNLSGNTHWWYTSFESTLSIPGLGTFIPGPFSHAEIRTGLDMGSDEAQITSFSFPGNPLLLLMPWTLTGDLNVDIFEIDRLSLTWNHLFQGTVEELDTEGAKITAKVLGFGGMYDQQFHRHVMAGDCPYAVYTPECGALRKAGTTITGKVVYVNGNSVIFNPPVGGGPNVFANGIMEFGGAGFKYQVIEITSNSSSTEFQLTRPPVGPIIGASVSVSLGCDGTIVSCEFIHNNLINFGGENNMPTTNPSVTAVTAKDNTAQSSSK